MVSECQAISRRKLKPLVITMGSQRQEYIEQMFANETMRQYFESPVFSQGIPSRSIRSQMALLSHAGKAGILPDDEWAAIRSPRAKTLFEEDGATFLEKCLEEVPVESGRHGAPQDTKLHFARELWQKGKSLNRQRSVLACTFAHLIAMKTLVKNDYDFILEDNVRAPIDSTLSEDAEILSETDEEFCECAMRIWNTIEASKEMEEETGVSCHLRYYGWLGSRPNLRAVYDNFVNIHKFQKADGDKRTVFPYVVNTDIDEMKLNGGDNLQKAGGTPLWGAYAYWISAEGHKAIISSLQKDVGSLLWKGKRMRCYQVKPVDKIIPRKVASYFSDGCKHIHVATHPAFFRAPMLTSQIHSKWDAAFCSSTEFQMKRCDNVYESSDGCDENDESTEVNNDEEKLKWRRLWLTAEERQIVEHRIEHGLWITMAELKEQAQNAS